MNKKSINEKRHNRILFDFESIVDIELSYINHLKIVKHRSGPRPSDIDYEILDDSMSNFKFRRMYVYENPIDRVFHGNSPENLNLLHPKDPVFTSMKILLEQFLRIPDNMIRPTVLCKDRFQERIIKQSIQGNVRTLIGERSQVKTINFTRIVLGDINHLLDFKNPVMVDFMLLNFRRNMSKENPEIIDKIAFLYGDLNQFTIAKAYPEIADPIKNG